MGRYSAQNSEYRARKYGLTEHFTDAEWQALCAKYGYRCVRCGQESPLVADHVVSLTAGGANVIENIQPLCKFCNESKGPRQGDYRVNARIYNSPIREYVNPEMIGQGVSLTPAEHERLRVAAARAGVSMREFVRRATLDAIDSPVVPDAALVEACRKAYNVLAYPSAMSADLIRETRALLRNALKPGRKRKQA